MKGHYTQASLERLLCGPADATETAAVIQHLSGCDQCWVLAASLCGHDSPIKERRKHSPSLLYGLISEEEQATLRTLSARAAWTELKELPPREQISRLRGTSSFQTLAMFRTILSDSWTVAPQDPYAGEQYSYVAFALVGVLPEILFPLPTRRDLEGEALASLANSRRLITNWNGCKLALDQAFKALKEGTGDPGLEALLLLMQAMLSADTGNLDVSYACSGRAADLYRSSGDLIGWARAIVVEGGNLLAGGQVEDAILKANHALELIQSREPKLELLARGIIIEANLVQGRTSEALHLFARARGLFSRIEETGGRLRISYLEACLLEALGSSREAERIFSLLIQKYLDAELYKEAFITMLTLFEALCNRKEFAKAASLCEKALQHGQQVEDSFNPQIMDAWTKLRDIAWLGELPTGSIGLVRTLVTRSWNLPAGPQVQLDLAGSQASELLLSEVAEPPASPPVPDVLTPSSYRAALEAYDQELIQAALQRTGGNLSEASRILGTSRPTLRAKIRRYAIEVPSLRS